MLPLVGCCHRVVLVFRLWDLDALILSLCRRGEPVCVVWSKTGPPCYQPSEAELGSDESVDGH